MAGRGTPSAKRARSEAERARVYAARTAWHEGRIRRRVRDNVLVGVVGGLLVVGAIGSQFVHAQVTAPEPTETTTPSPTAPVVETPASTPEPSVVPTETPAG
ncbi:hypothetical protein ACWGJP_11610 [Microbacterium sp. NPDC055903]